MFEFLDHTADVAVRLRSRDEAGLFRDAMRALLAIVLDEERSAPVEPREAREVRLEAEDAESLLVDYLNELIFLFDTARFLARDLEASRIELGRPARLDGRLLGERFDPARHLAKTEVKATTFHGMEVRRGPEGLEAEVVFDL
ncbi:MAG: archease [Planctomycetes bacterium]|nr:archease [Planctomycetota bacterium]